MYKVLPLFASVGTSALSMTANGIVTMAVPWALLKAGVSPMWAGVAAALLHAPVVIGMAVGGHLADRFGARAVLMASNALAALAGLLAAAMAIQDAALLPVIVAALAVANGAGAPGTIAQDARVPELARFAGVPLERANGVRDIVANLGQAGGPAAGVLLVEGFGLAGAVIAAGSLLLLIALIDAATFPRSRVRLSNRLDAQGPHHGFAILRADPALRTVAVLGVPLVAIFASLDEILAPTLALASGLGGETLSLFLALAGGSALVSAGLFAIVGHRVRKRPVLLGGLAVTAVGLAGMAVLPPGTAFLVPPVLMGFGIGPLWPLIVTAIHRRIPSGERGRVIGALGGVVLIAQPVASLAAGPAVAWAGPFAVALALAGLAALIALAAPFLPGLRALDPVPAASAPVVCPSQGTPVMRRAILIAGGLAVLAWGAYVARGALGLADAQPVTLASPVVPSSLGIGALGRIEPASRALRIVPASGADGRIEQLLVQAGDRVAAGAVIARLSDHAVRASALATAAAQVRVAQAELARVRAGARPQDLAAQRARGAALRAQLQLAEATRERRARLLPSQAASAAQFDEAQAVVDRLQSELDSAEAVLAGLATVRPEDIAVAEAALARAEADEAHRRAELRLSEVVAPIDGTILAVHAREGERPGADGIAVIADLERMEVAAEVYETDVARMREGAHARVLLPNEAEPLSATVDRIGWLIRRNDAIGTDPAARIDARVVEVRLRLDPASSARVARLTHMQVAVSIDPAGTVSGTPATERAR